MNSHKLIKKTLIFLLLFGSCLLLTISITWFYVRIIFIGPSIETFKFGIESVNTASRIIHETDESSNIIYSPLFSIVKNHYYEDDNYVIKLKYKFKYDIRCDIFSGKENEWLGDYYYELIGESLFWDLYPLNRIFKYKGDRIMFKHYLTDGIFVNDDIRFSYYTTAIIPEKSLMIQISGYDYDVNTVIPIIIRLVYNNRVGVDFSKSDTWKEI